MILSLVLLLCRLCNNQHVALPFTLCVHLRHAYPVGDRHDDQHTQRFGHHCFDHKLKVYTDFVLCRDSGPAIYSETSMSIRNYMESSTVQNHESGEEIGAHEHRHAQEHVDL